MAAVTISKTIKRPINTRLIERTVRQTAQAVRGSIVGGVSVVVVGNDRMRQLQRRFRGKDTVTDVLSFPYQSDDFPVGDDQQLLGEIVIAYPVLLRQAKAHDISAAAELALLVCHGTLHLLGYDHEQSAAEAKKVDQLQRKVLAKLGFALPIVYN